MCVNLRKRGGGVFLFFLGRGGQEDWGRERGFREYISAVS